MSNNTVITTRENQADDTLPQGPVFNGKEFLRRILEIRKLMEEHDPHIFERDWREVAKEPHLG